MTNYKRALVILARNAVKRRIVKDWNEEDHPRDPDGKFGSGGGSGGSGSESGKPKIIKTQGSVKSVSGGGSRGQIHIVRSGSEEHIMVQTTKKDGSWGKPRALKLLSGERENPEKALKRMEENNPGTKWRFDPDNME